MRDKIMYDLVYPYIKHLSLSGRNQVCRQVERMSDEEFDSFMVEVRSGQITFTDF